MWVPCQIALEKETRMPNVDGKACFVLTLLNKEPREIILSLGRLLAGVSLVILAPLVSAQPCNYNAPNLGFNSFDSTYSSGRYQRAYIQDTDNCDVAEVSDDNAGGSAPDSNCYGSGSNACLTNGGQESPATQGSKPGEDARTQTSDERLRSAKPADFNRDIYFKNKLEFSLDGGWFPINIPFIFDCFEGDAYNTYPLKYTLVPIIASLRWHLNDIYGPLILRGNWDLSLSGSATAIPRGAETRYFSYDMAIRRNFVPRNWRVSPYWDIRLGLGDIDAKGPEGVRYAQGQDFTFTANMGSGVRYNFNPRYAISAGLNYMHISNAGLSQPQVANYGINVYGPMFGLDIQLRRHQRQSE
jgi:hypothetical protein